jgi:hypothetical protein
VCTYWGSIFLKCPVLCIALVILSPLIPILWLDDKLTRKFEGKSFCPFGKVEIEKE